MIAVDAHSHLLTSVPGRSGFSGAPLLNRRGEVVAIHVASARDRRAPDPDGEIGVAVDAWTASRHLSGLPPRIVYDSSEAAIAAAPRAVCHVVSERLRDPGSRSLKRVIGAAE